VEEKDELVTQCCVRSISLCDCDQEKIIKERTEFLESLVRGDYLKDVRCAFEVMAENEPERAEEIMAMKEDYDLAVKDASEKFADSWFSLEDHVVDNRDGTYSIITIDPDNYSVETVDEVNDKVNEAIKKGNFVIREDVF